MPDHESCAALAAWLHGGAAHQQLYASYPSLIPAHPVMWRTYIVWLHVQAAGYLVLRRTCTAKPRQVQPLVSDRTACDTAGSHTAGAAAGGVSSAAGSDPNPDQAQPPAVPGNGFNPSTGVADIAAGQQDEAQLPISLSSSSESSECTAVSAHVCGNCSSCGDASNAVDRQAQLRMYEYHIVHSAAYGVPVLFLRGSHSGVVLVAENTGSHGRITLSILILHTEEVSCGPRKGRQYLTYVNTQQPSSCLHH